jgi:serine/threonine protein kinase/tetratricopeptide (TPR) repeat protein
VRALEAAGLEAHMGDFGSTRFGKTGDDSAEPAPADERHSGTVPARAFGEDGLIAPASRSVAQLRAATTLHGGRFEVRHPLGKGGMGVVYEVFDNERQAAVALKVVRPLALTRSALAPNAGVSFTDTVDPLGAYRFKQEFRALADVLHPNLVRLHELFTVGEPWFFTMDLVLGSDFVEATQSSDPQRAVLRDALRQLVDGVNAIHAAGKLHCDIKPSNVLVTPEGRVVILDFGLVVDADEGGVGRTIDEGAITGTPGYMSPEQANGARPTAASDVYAMGVMLFEALTGKLPFSGGVHAQLAQRLTVPFPRPSSIASGIPEDLESLCLRMCQSDPAARPSASELRIEIGPSRSSVAPSLASDAPASRKLLIGRERELSALHAAYRQSKSGKPTVVLLSGESGIGKSALISAFFSELREPGQAVVLSGKCYERESIPYKAFDAVVDELTRYLRRLGDTAMALLPRDVSALARLFPVLNRVPAIANAPERDATGTQEQLRAFASLEEMLGRIRDRRPLVLAIDDLQWADEDSIDLLCYLFNRAGPWLWLLSYRSEEVGRNPLLGRIIEMLAGTKKIRYEVLQLGPLSVEASEHLAHSLIATPSAHDQLALVARESGGIPLFVAELVRHVQARGEIESAAPSLIAALQSRIEALEPSERDSLEVVSVASRPLQRNILLGASQHREQAHRALDALLLGHLLRWTSAGTERRLEPYHDRIRETVIALLATSQVQDVHRRLVQSLVRLNETDPEHLTVHLEGAGEYAQAAEQAILAAQRANVVLAFDRAARLYAHALELGRFTGERKHVLTILLADALASAGRSYEAASAYLESVCGADTDEAQELRKRAAEELMISGRAQQGLEVMSTMLVELGLAPVRGGAQSLLSLLVQRSLLSVRGLGYRARSRDQISSLERKRMDVCWVCARGLTLIDQIQGADFATRYLRMALNSGDVGSIGRGLALESGYRANFGEDADAEALMSRARSIASASSDPFLHAWVICFSAINAFLRSDYDAAVEGLEKALFLYREHCPGAIWEATNARSFLGWSLWNKGDYKRLRQLLLQAVQDANSRGDLLAAVTMSTGVFGSAWLIRDEVDEVVRFHRIARETWPSIIYDLQRALSLLGETLLDFYLGNGRNPWPRFDAEWPQLKNAPIMRNHIARAQLLYARASCALVAARASDGSRSRTLWSVARSCEQQLASMKRDVARGYEGIVSASLACMAGDAEGAIAALTRAARAFDDQGSAMLATAARSRLGALKGGDDGRRLLQQVDEFMQAQTVLRPDRIIAMLTPACELVGPSSKC